MISEWPVFFLCEATDANLDVCLDKGGQSFTWIRASPDDWINCFDSQIVHILRRESKVMFSIERKENELPIRSMLREYFRLDFDLTGHYKVWSKDRVFKELSVDYPGLRLLRQDPYETLFAFICSQNNAIPRITKMVMSLKSAYGKKVGECLGHDVYSFPNIHRLAEESVEADLRTVGFGYRAKYIRNAARYLIENNIDLFDFRNQAYEHVHEQLIEIPGIGPKVADCIALMSLDQLGAVPVDTHIWQVACKFYKFKGVPAAKSSMTKSVYKSIGAGFLKVFGDKAGWAHLILFAAQSRTRLASKFK